MALDLTALDSVLKQHYHSDAIKNLVYKKNPFLAMIPKMTRFGGKNLPLPLRFADPQNRSADFRSAQRSNSGGPSTRGSSAFEDFVLTRVKNYGTAELDAEAVQAAQADIDTFVREAANEIDGLLRSISNDLAFDLFRDGSGLKATIATASVAANSVITFNEAGAARHFEKGMLLEASATAGGSRRSPTDIPEVIAVDRSGNSITVNANVTTYGSPWAASDFVYQYGDGPNGGANKKVTGLAGWVPSTAPTSSSFFGVDRTQDATRLGGVRYDGSAETIEEALIGAHMELAIEGGDPDVVFMNHLNTAELIKQLGSKKDYVEVNVAGVGFQGVRVMTTEGELTVMSDRNCPPGTAYMLQMDTWGLYSLGEAPRILGQEGDEDGLRMLRLANDDGYEVRAGFYAQVGCDAPGYNAVITLAS
jgi:hypothetical protein